MAASSSKPKPAVDGDNSRMCHDSSRGPHRLHEHHRASHAKKTTSLSQRSFKIVIVGDQSVGKTSIIGRFVGNQRTENGGKATPQDSTSSGRGSHTNSEEDVVEPRTTVGASFCQVILRTSSAGQITLNVWDTAGQERFRAMVGMYYRNADAAVAVYDVTNHHSFLSLKKWIRELRENTRQDVVIAVVGNKTDLRGQRTVDPKEAASFAAAIGAAYFETTIKNRRKIHQLFMDLADSLVELPDLRSQAFTASFQVQRSHADTKAQEKHKVHQEGGSRCCSAL